MKIGLMLPLGEDETNGFADLRAMAIAAEEGGLDSVWGHHRCRRHLLGAGGPRHGRRLGSADRDAALEPDAHR